MKKLAQQRFILRQNLLAIIGVCLCFYFSYHLAFGTRSYVGLTQTEAEIVKVSAAYEQAKAERIALEDRVRRMRPDGLDRDLLEEQARSILGFSYEDERIIIQR